MQGFLMKWEENPLASLELYLAVLQLLLLP